MLNQVVLVGKLVEELELKEGEDGNDYGIIKLSVSRPFKNEEGIYEYDYIDCLLKGGIVANCKEYCHKGDIVGVKARLEKLENEDLKIVAEKITFLSTKKED